MKRASTVCMLFALAACGGGATAATELQAPHGFILETIASIRGARELAPLPNGDLLVGSSGSNIYIIAHADARTKPDAPSVFATVDDSDAAGIAFDPSSSTIFVGSNHGVYAIPYSSDERSAHRVTKIASVRTRVDTGHSTTSVAVANGVVYASVGSSCNACTETDPTRATIQQMNRDGSKMTPKAVHIRNAIALAVDPGTHHLWAGDAGQDELPQGHPYEFFDDVTAREGIVNYGWPACEENHQNYDSGANCANVAVPIVELPAYETLVGAAFYPETISGPFAFPHAYRGGAFVAAHGSWHQIDGRYASMPQVVFVPISGGKPRTPVDWKNPTTQWTPFLTGFQKGDGVTRVGRPTGVAVGALGSLFVADDDAGAVYRIRP